MAFRLSENEKVQYERDGVVCLRGVLNANEIDGLRRAVDTQVQQRHRSKTAYDFEQIGSDLWQDDQAMREHGATRLDLSMMKKNVHSDDQARPMRDGESQGGQFFYDVAGWKHFDEIRRAAFDSALPEIAFDLLDTGYVNFWEDTTFVKTPGTAQQTAFHQDYGYFQITGRKCLIAWIALDEATLENGVMEYVRGSHKWPETYAPNVFVAQTPTTGSQDERLPDIEGNRSNFDIIHFDVSPGDVLLHDVRTIHGTSGNLSKHMRRAISFRYCGDDIRFFDRPGAVQQVNTDHGLSDGDRLLSDQYPIVYPKPWPSLMISELYNQAYIEGAA